MGLARSSPIPLGESDSDISSTKTNRSGTVACAYTKGQLSSELEPSPL